MKPKNLIGLTIAEAKQKIIKAENQNFDFQIYVIEKKEVFKNFKKCFKKHHLRDENGKRIYYTTNNLYYYYAEKIDLEKDNIIIDVKIEKGTADAWSFKGFEKTYEINIYNLIVNKLTKGNKGKAHLIKCDKKIYQYKEGELTPKQKRFTL